MNDRYFPKADIQFSIIEFLVERLPREQDVLEARIIAVRKLPGRRSRSFSLLREIRKTS